MTTTGAVEAFAIIFLVGVAVATSCFLRVIWAMDDDREAPKVEPWDARDRVVVRFERNDRERLQAAVQASLTQKDGPWMSDASKRMY